MARDIERFESSKLGALLWQGFLNEGISVRHRNGSTTFYKVTPVTTIPALGDFKAWETRRRAIEFVNRVLMEGTRRRA